MKSGNDEQDAEPSSGLWDEIEVYSRALMDESMEAVRKRNFRDAGRHRRRPQHLAPLRENEEVTNVMNGPNDMTLLVGHRAYLPEVAAAIQEDIEGIKDRYIVGKIVGRDLMDKNGKQMARQGERITRVMVQEADKAGLLVDLIEFMTFESFED